MNYQEIYPIARKQIDEMLQECIETHCNPQLMKIWYEGYKTGLEETGADFKPDGWHFIDIEGLPPINQNGESERCFLLIKADWHIDTSFGYYEKERGRWITEYWNSGHEKVVAWHPLPEIPQTE